MSPDDHHELAVPPPGTVMDDKYVVGEVLARGGMGCLVKAEHALMLRAVAIKFVLRRGSADARLLREARALQALESDYAVQVFDLGIHDGSPYIVMELLEGLDLGEHVANEGPLSVEDAVDCTIEAGAALVEAHALGIIHRDVKPSNLFLTETRGRRRVKLLDFGISKLAPELRDEDLEKTAEDSVLGTPFYMSPEQIRNPARIDERTDVWSLAVTLFHMLSGEHPFRGDTAREVTGAIFTDPPRQLGSDLPRDLDEAIRAALAKRPEDRTATVKDFVDALLPYASKRGRDAAEAIAALPDAPIRVARATTAAVDRLGTDRLGTTEDALSTARPTTASRGGPRHAAPAPARNRAPMWIAGVAAAAGAVWLGMQREAPKRPAALPAIASATTRPAVDSARPPTTASASVAPLPAPPPAASSAPTSQPAPPEAPRVARPAASPTPSVAPSAPAVDIDGVPIVE